MLLLGHLSRDEVPAALKKDLLYVLRKSPQVCCCPGVLCKAKYGLIEHCQHCVVLTKARSACSLPLAPGYADCIAPLFSTVPELTQPALILFSRP